MAYKLALGITQTEHEGKLLGIPSISTCCLTNPICLARMQNGDSVCAHCYAATLMKIRKALKEAMIRNMDILTDHVLTIDELDGMEIKFTPKMRELNPEMFAREESFGDVSNVTQAINYFLIAKRNGAFKWAIWTKNHWIVAEAYRILGWKPDNLSIGYSSPKLNEVVDLSTLDPDFVKICDFVFTVFTKQFAKEHGIKINCGGRACRKCGQCYKSNKTKAETGRIVYVNEELK